MGCFALLHVCRRRVPPLGDVTALQAGEDLRHDRVIDQLVGAVGEFLRGHLRPFLPMQAPAALHLAGDGQLEQGLNFPVDLELP